MSRNKEDTMETECISSVSETTDVGDNASKETEETDLTVKPDVEEKSNVTVKTGVTDTCTSAERDVRDTGKSEPEDFDFEVGACNQSSEEDGVLEDVVEEDEMEAVTELPEAGEQMESSEDEEEKLSQEEDVKNEEHCFAEEIHVAGEEPVDVVVQMSRNEDLSGRAASKDEEKGGLKKSCSSGAQEGDGFEDIEMNLTGTEREDESSQVEMKNIDDAQQNEELIDLEITNPTDAKQAEVPSQFETMNNDDARDEKFNETGMKNTEISEEPSIAEGQKGEDVAIPFNGDLTYVISPRHKKRKSFQPAVPDVSAGLAEDSTLSDNSIKAENFGETLTEERPSRFDELMEERSNTSETCLREEERNEKNTNTCVVEEFDKLRGEEAPTEEGISEKLISEEALAEEEISGKVKISENSRVRMSLRSLNDNSVESEATMTKNVHVESSETSPAENVEKFGVHSSRKGSPENVQDDEGKAPGPTKKRRLENSEHDNSRTSAGPQVLHWYLGIPKTGQKAKNQSKVRTPPVKPPENSWTGISPTDHTFSTGQVFLPASQPLQMKTYLIPVSNQSKPPPMSVVPSVNALPTVPTIPTIPTVPRVQIVPTVSTIHTVPTVPMIHTVHHTVPTMHTVPTVTQVRMASAQSKSVPVSCVPNIHTVTKVTQMASTQPKSIPVSCVPNIHTIPKVTQMASAQPKSIPVSCVPNIHTVTKVTQTATAQPKSIPVSCVPNIHTVTKVTQMASTQPKSIPVSCVPNIHTVTKVTATAQPKSIPVSCVPNIHTVPKVTQIEMMSAVNGKAQSTVGTIPTVTQVQQDHPVFKQPVLPVGSAIPTAINPALENPSKEGKLSVTQHLFKLEVTTISTVNGVMKPLTVTVLNVASVTFKCGKCSEPYKNQLSSQHLQMFQHHKCKTVVNKKPASSGVQWTSSSQQLATGVSLVNAPLTRATAKALGASITNTPQLVRCGQSAQTVMNAHLQTEDCSAATSSEDVKTKVTPSSPKKERLPKALQPKGMPKGATKCREGSSEEHPHPVHLLSSKNKQLELIRSTGIFGERIPSSKDEKENDGGDDCYEDANGDDENSAKLDVEEEVTDDGSQGKADVTGDDGANAKDDAKNKDEATRDIRKRSKHNDHGYVKIIGKKRIREEFCIMCYLKLEHKCRAKIIAANKKVDKFCTFCQKTFKYAINFNEHMRGHTDERPYQCEECGKAFRRKPTLQEHMLIHGGEYNFLCSICGKKFLRKGDHRAHMKRHNDSFRLRCRECNKGFKSRSHLETHMRSHTGEMPFLCTVCGKTFRQNFSLQIHMKFHEMTDNPLKCIGCQVEFEDADELRRHHCPTGKKHLCSVCGRTFVNPFMTKSHMKLHLRPKPSPCKSCQVTFPNEAELQQHYDENLVKCCGCKKVIREARICMLKAVPGKISKAKKFKCWKCHSKEGEAKSSAKSKETLSVSSETAESSNPSVSIQSEEPDQQSPATQPSQRAPITAAKPLQSTQPSNSFEPFPPSRTQLSQTLGLVNQSTKENLQTQLKSKVLLKSIPPIIATVGNPSSQANAATGSHQVKVSGLKSASKPFGQQQFIRSTVYPREQVQLKVIRSSQPLTPSNQSSSENLSQSASMYHPSQPLSIRNNQSVHGRQITQPVVSHHEQTLQVETRPGPLTLQTQSSQTTLATAHLQELPQEQIIYGHQHHPPRHYHDNIQQVQSAPPTSQYPTQHPSQHNHHSQQHQQVSQQQHSQQIPQQQQQHPGQKAATYHSLSEQQLSLLPPHPRMGHL